MATDRLEANQSISFHNKTLEGPSLLKFDQNSSRKRIKGGVSGAEFEKLYGHISVTKQPSFMERKDSYRGIGWGVLNSKLTTLPAISDNLKRFLKHRKSEEESVTQNYLNSPIKLENRGIAPQESHQSMSRKPSLNNRDFVKQIDKEYKSTGASGFLRLNGSFSNHVDKKLQLKPDLYHSLNMMSQKKAIFRKFNNSVNALSKNAGDTKSSHFTKTNSDNMALGGSSKVMMMYNRCEKHENWKKFQIKRSQHNLSLRHSQVTSTLPALKFQKEKLFKPKKTFSRRKS
ncbi:unnamed protein product [Moneuplotes crassus]|uniref:Uncharacterized protein n=1 Tax=Euplotes crassus TaxID=5936 RepID=A0AAD1XPH2_EUPCR|nr:unnamed protein product [Moneuplotes crassus]